MSLRNNPTPGGTDHTRRMEKLTDTLKAALDVLGRPNVTWAHGLYDLVEDGRGFDGDEVAEAWGSEFDPNLDCHVSLWGAIEIAAAEGGHDSTPAMEALTKWASRQDEIPVLADGVGTPEEAMVELNASAATAAEVEGYIRGALDAATEGTV